MRAVGRDRLRLSTFCLCRRYSSYDVSIISASITSTLLCSLAADRPYLYFSHKCYDWGLRAPYDLNSHGARTVAVESHGRREIFWTFFTHRTMNRSF